MRILNAIKIEKVGKHNCPYIIIEEVSLYTCFICLKKRKTTGHHVIPLRANTLNTQLHKLKIRVCKKCNKKIHPENGEINGHEIIKKMEKSITKFKAERKNFNKEFFKRLDERIEQLKHECGELPDKLKDNLKALHPAQKMIEGRIKEIYHIKYILNDDIYRKYRR